MASTNESLTGVNAREATPEEIAHRDGYVKGRNDESYVQGNLRSQERAFAQAQANDSAASGVLLGMVIAILAVLVGGAAYLFTGDRADNAPSTVPQIEREKTIERETTIIERDSPLPDVSLPDVQVDVPDVEVNLPEVSLPDASNSDEAADPKVTEPAEAVADPAVQ